jgi:hypothetical protein
MHSLRRVCSLGAGTFAHVILARTKRQKLRPKHLHGHSSSGGTSAESSGGSDGGGGGDGVYAEAVAAAGAVDAAFTGLDAEMKLELDLLAEQERGGQQDLSSDEGSDDSEGSSGSGSEEGGSRSGGGEVARGEHGHGDGSKHGHSPTDSSTCYYYAVKVTVTVTVTETVWPPFVI